MNTLNALRKCENVLTDKLEEIKEENASCWPDPESRGKEIDELEQVLERIRQWLAEFN